MLSNNGIAQAPNGTIYVASTLGKAVRVFERQEDNSIVLMDVIPSGEIRSNRQSLPPRRLNWYPEAPLDNIALDSDGVVWAAGELPLQQNPKNFSHQPLCRIPQLIHRGHQHEKSILLFTIRCLEVWHQHWTKLVLWGEIQGRKGRVPAHSLVSCSLMTRFTPRPLKIMVN